MPKQKLSQTGVSNYFQETNHERRRATPVANNHGGTHNRRVMFVPYPIVAERVGKYALKDRDVTMQVNVAESHHTFQSLMAKRSPGHHPCSFDSMPSPKVRSSSYPISSAMRSRATAFSDGESQLDEFSGKSGRMNIDKKATRIVIVPSTKKSHLWRE